MHAVKVKGKEYVPGGYAPLECRGVTPAVLWRVNSGICAVSADTVLILWTVELVWSGVTNKNQFVDRKVQTVSYISQSGQYVRVEMR